MAAPPLAPRNPERICWGCDKYCPANDLACGNGTIRTLHPIELFGDDWLAWSEGAEAADGRILSGRDAPDRRHAREDPVVPEGGDRRP